MKTIKTLAEAYASTKNLWVQDSVTNCYVTLRNTTVLFESLEVGIKDKEVPWSELPGYLIADLIQAANWRKENWR